jgi:Protein of unknown function (DUF3592)
VLVAVGGWLYLRPSAFYQRAVITEATIDDLRSGPVDDTPDGIARWSVYASVRYVVDGNRIQARTAVGQCRGSGLFSYHVGDTVQVGYDPENVHRAALATAGQVPKTSPLDGGCQCRLALSA